MDRFTAISTFIAVVDRHGFAPAARHLGLAPSAVTRQVAALEAHLGVRLLARQLAQRARQQTAQRPPPGVFALQPRWAPCARASPVPSLRR